MDKQSLYSVSIMTRDEEGALDLYTYAVVADSDEEAVGYVMLNENPTEHGAIVMVNTDEARREDAERCYGLTAFKDEIKGISRNFRPDDDEDAVKCLRNMREALASAVEAMS